MNVEYSLELGETPSYSASHQAPNHMYVQRSEMLQKSLNRFGAVAARLRLLFSVYLNSVLYVLFPARPLSLFTLSILSPLHCDIPWNYLFTIQSLGVGGVDCQCISYTSKYPKK